MNLLLTSKIIFIIGIILWLLVRIPYQREQQKNTIVDDRKTAQERVIRFLLLVGKLFLPLIYVLSPWLNFANPSISLGKWIRGCYSYTFALVILAYSSRLGQKLVINAANPRRTHINNQWRLSQHSSSNVRLCPVIMHCTSAIAAKLDCRSIWIHRF